MNQLFPNRYFQTSRNTSLGLFASQYQENTDSLDYAIKDKVLPVGNVASGEGTRRPFRPYAEVHIVHLRPAFFMENLLMNVDLIRRQGINGTPLKSDLKFPAIATRDIAFKAVEYLSAPTTVRLNSSQSRDQPCKYIS